MSAPYFYAPLLTDHTGAFELSEETSKHIVQVLRMKEGELLKLTNGNGLLAEASIVAAHKKHTTVNISSISKEPEPPGSTIAISPIKNTARFEWFLEKAAELGIRKIVPIICQRTEKQHLRQDRLQGILVSAMLQSQQVYLTNLTEPISFNQFIAQENPSQKLIAHCIDAEKKNLFELSLQPNVVMLIGPEGDFTEQEIRDAIDNHFEPVSLGPTRLRTETAGMAAAVLINQHLKR